jgi:fibronectin-binding autotransporter adhesin
MIRFKMVVAASLIALLFASITLPKAVFAAGNTCTWTGASNTSWGTAGNWTSCGGTVPQNGDSLVFDDSVLSSSVSLTNNLTNLQVGSISFINNSINTYTINGNAISLSGGVSSTGVIGDSLHLGVTLTADQTFSTQTGLHVGISSANLVIGSHALTIDGGGSVSIDSPIVGGGTLALNSTGSWGLLGQDSPNFTGIVDIRAETRLIINAAQSQALGTAAVTVHDTGVLQESVNVSANTYVLGNNITMQGDGDNGSNHGAINVHDFTGTGTSTLTLTGTITLTNNAKADLDDANLNIQSQPVGCGFSITKSAGSSGAGGNLTGNLTGTCAVVTTATTTPTTTTSISAPNTGYGQPSAPSRLVLALSLISLTVVVAGLGLLRRQHAD